MRVPERLVEGMQREGSVGVVKIPGPHAEQRSILKHPPPRRPVRNALGNGEVVVGMVAHRVVQRMLALNRSRDVRRQCAVEQAEQRRERKGQGAGREQGQHAARPGRCSTPGRKHHHQRTRAQAQPSAPRPTGDNTHEHDDPQQRQPAPPRTARVNHGGQDEWQMDSQVSPERVWLIKRPECAQESAHNETAGASLRRRLDHAQTGLHQHCRADGPRHDAPPARLAHDVGQDHESRGNLEPLEDFLEHLGRIDRH